MGTGPRQLPAAKLGLGKWLQARRKARRARGKAPPETGVPPSFLSESLGCREGRQGTTRRPAAALGRRGLRALPRSGAARPGGSEAGAVDSEVATGKEGLVYPPARVRAEPRTSLQSSLQGLFERDGVTNSQKVGSQRSPWRGGKLLALRKEQGGVGGRRGAEAAPPADRVRGVAGRSRLSPRGRAHLGSPGSDRARHKEHLSEGGASAPNPGLGGGEAVRGVE